MVVSEHKAHTGSELCKSPFTAGPDFASTKEGIFCDMCARELWLLCSEGVPTGSFDMDLKAMRANNRTITKIGLYARDRLTGRDIPQKEYRNTLHWT